MNRFEIRDVGSFEGGGAEVKIFSLNLPTNRNKRVWKKSKKVENKKTEEKYQEEETTKKYECIKEWCLNL